MMTIEKAETQNEIEGHIRYLLLGYILRFMSRLIKNNITRYPTHYRQP